MKLPYVKLYTADLLAASRHLTAQQLGEALLGICEQAFENATDYQPETAREQAFFEQLLCWKNEAEQSYKQRKKAGRKGGRVTGQKSKKIVGSEIKIPASSTTLKQTETDTETETETETENNITPIPPTAQGENIRSLSGKEKELAEFARQADKGLSEFARRVAKRFEENVRTEDQHRIWFHKNRRKLKDIWEFCGKDIPLALQTISVCARSLEKAGLTGGYAAVCRNLPEYMFRAQQELAT